jgi:hypothetical protein
MRDIVGTLPAPLVATPGVAGVYQRITVTNVAATLLSLLANGRLPDASVPNTNAGQKYVFGGVDIQSDTDPSSIAVRYTDNGSDPVTATLGFVLPAGASWVRIITDLQNIQLISTGANVNCQVRLLVTSVNKV